MTLRALDLFCGAGGAARGLMDAGFEVLGVDCLPQPRYPGRFVLADALRPPVRLADFDLVWASPPCQRYSRATPERTREEHPDLISQVRKMLSEARVKAWVIENVPGAPLRPDLMLDGSMFDLLIIRQRIFEIHGFRPPFLLSRQRTETVSSGGLACVAGRGANKAWRDSWRAIPDDIKRALSRRNSAAGWRDAMSINWMTREELRNAVPPAYTQWIGKAAAAALTAATA